MATRRPAPTRRLRLALLSIALAVALAAGACGDDDDTPARTGTSAPTTTATTVANFEVVGGDLYDPPEPLPGDAHGDLIWAEPIDEWWGSPRRAWRVLYRSESLSGEPIAVSGFVIAPPEDAAADGSRPIVSWAHGTVGSADQCAPSRTFGGQPAGDEIESTIAAQLTGFVDAGAVVVATDYEGLGTPGPHPFLVGESAGRSVLDAALAVRQLPNAGAGDRLAIYGVSQGGHAALWAGQLASSWAPELDVVGVVAAAPFSEVDVLLPAASTIPGGEGYLVLGVYGQAAANPELDPEAVLDPAVVAQANVVEERCTPDVHAVFRQVAVDLGGPIAKLDALAGPDWSAQLASIKPGTTRIDVPVLIVQGERDTTIPAATTRILVSRMCANATSVGTVYKDAGHSEVVVAADREIRDWLTARLTGEPATSSCGSGG